MDTIAPESERQRLTVRYFGALAIVGAIAAAFGFAQRGGSPAAARPFELGLVMLALGILGSAYLMLWLRNSRLLVGVDRFGYRDAFGRDHTWSQGDVARVVDISILQAGKLAASRRLIYFLRPDGRRVFILSANAWSSNGIDRIVRATGRSLEAREPMTRAQFQADFPNATTWIGKHQNLTVGAMVLGGGAVVLGVLLAPGLLHG